MDMLRLRGVAVYVSTFISRFTWLRRRRRRPWVDGGAMLPAQPPLLSTIHAGRQITQSVSSILRPFARQKREEKKTADKPTRNHASSLFIAVKNCFSDFLFISAIAIALLLPKSVAE